MKKKPSFDWKDFFSNVRKTNRGKLLPYVTRLAQSAKDDPEKRAFLVLVSTIISLRTQDKTTETASEKIFRLADSPKKMLRLSEEKISAAIYPCGFYRTKAGQILKISKILVEKNGGKVPRLLDSLMQLPGVGRKTANLVLTEGFGLPGICVDTHVHRILNRVGAVKSKTPDKTEIRLREILPKTYWKKINLWLVMFGQYHCKPIHPLCEKCAWRPHCPSKTEI